MNFWVAVVAIGILAFGLASIRYAIGELTRTIENHRLLQSTGKLEECLKEIAYQLSRLHIDTESIHHNLNAFVNDLNNTNEERARLALEKSTAEAEAAKLAFLEAGGTVEQLEQIEKASEADCERAKRF